MDQDRIIDKIKKCLALSQSSNAGEAANALRQAQKLMEMHGITEAKLGQSEIGEAKVKSAASVSRVKDWELRLFNIVAKAFGCRLMFTRSNSYYEDVFASYKLLGLKSQVELAQYTTIVLQRRLMKARAEFVAGLTSPYMSRGRKTTEADGFCHGWVQAIGKTVHEFALTDEQKALIEAAYKDRTNGQTAKVQHRNIGEAGLQAGYQAGKNESLHHPVHAAAPTLRIGS